MKFGGRQKGTPNKRTALTKSIDIPLVLCLIYQAVLLFKSMTFPFF